MHGRNVKNISTYNNKLILDLLFTKEYSCTEIANMIGITHVAVTERLHETPIEFPVDVYLSRVDFPLNEGLQQLARRIAIDELCSENLSNQ